MSFIRKGKIYFEGNGYMQYKRQLSRQNAWSPYNLTVIYTFSQSTDMDNSEPYASIAIFISMIWLLAILLPLSLSCSKWGWIQHYWMERVGKYIHVKDREGMIGEEDDYIIFAPRSACILGKIHISSMFWICKIFFQVVKWFCLHFGSTMVNTYVHPTSEPNFCILRPLPFSKTRNV